MGLNIKNERVHALAREAARRTGKTQTGAIEEALEKLLGDLDGRSDDERQARYDAIMRAAEAFDALLTDADREKMSRFAEDMYDDETGLPR